jgi:hypothetical protein
MHVKVLSLSQSLLIAGALAGMALAATPSQAQNDPPGSARLMHLEGNVSIQPNGLDNWGQAYFNMPVGPGDRIFTDQQGRGELQVGPVRAYVGPNADLTLVNYDQNGIQLGLAQGSAAFFSDGFPPGMELSVQTPNGAVIIPTRTGFRVDVYPDQQSTIVTNYSKAGTPALVGAGGFNAALTTDSSIQLAGTNPVYAQSLQPAQWDYFAHWSLAFETHRAQSISAQYVSVEMPGYDELDGAGDWQPQSDYGPIWFPHVEAGWAPYHFGHWVSQPFYGWTWVADEPWGVAPFHYGRWVVVGNRWGWIPGPREGHPIWSPAQVVFAGGIQVGGVGVSAWFPLGPGEAYRPWYPCSPQYINQINITNIHESRIVHVQTTYINVVNVTNVTYVNRTVGVTAMSQADFAAGHSTRTVAVKIDPHQLDHVQPARPEARPPAQPVILHPVAKPAAVQAARPVLINSKGQQAAAAPNAKPVPVAVKAAPPAPKPIPGHAPIGKPSLGGKPVPAAAPAATKPAPEPAKAVSAKPAPPTPAEKPAPAKAIPAEKPAPAKATPPAAKPATPPTAIKPQAPVVKPPATEAKPAKPAEEKPAPPSKDNKKKGEKKDEKKTPPEKPE